VPRLEAPELATRELADREIAALVGAPKDEQARLVVLLLLTGVTAQELIALRSDDIDLNAGVIHVDGEAARTILLQEPLLGALVRRGGQDPDGEGTVIRDRQGSRVAIDEVSRCVLYAADDAGLTRSYEVTPDVLRYTYLSFLLRQGIRAADVDRIVGYVPPNDLVAYMRRHSPAARLPFEQVERVLPALRALAEKRLIPPAIDQV
jgi:integrase